MAFKFVILCCLVAAASAGLLQAAAPLAYSAPAAYHSAPAAYHSAPVAYSGLSYQAAPVAYAQPIAKVVAPIAKVAIAEPYDPNPQVSFAYDVQDGLTGDSKSQHESRSGDVVQGSYSVVDPDGFKRTVDYTADPHNGFNAVVRREPLGHVAKVAVAPVAKIAAPLAYAAPVAKIASPIGYAAPLAHSAPLAYSSSVYH